MINDINTKECSKCSECKPATLEFFNTQIRGKFGLKSYCKECQSISFKKWYQLNKEDQQAKSISRYYDNPEKSKESNTAWRKANPEKSKARNRASWWRHREKRIQETIEDGRKNKEAKLARCQAYRARQRGAEGRFTSSEFKQVVSNQKNLCFYCQEQMTTPVAEHVTPLARGGSNWITNIVASCQTCNSSKGSKTLEEFRPDLIATKPIKTWA